MIGYIELQGMQYVVLMVVAIVGIVIWNTIVYPWLLRKAKRDDRR